MVETCRRNSDRLLTASKLSILAGYVMPDLIYLRSCLAMGALLGGINNATKSPPVYTEVYWAAAFLGVNSIMILNILRDRHENQI